MTRVLLLCIAAAMLDAIAQPVIAWLDRSGVTLSKLAAHAGGALAIGALGYAIGRGMVGVGLLTAGAALAGLAWLWRVCRRNGY